MPTKKTKSKTPRRMTTMQRWQRMCVKGAKPVVIDGLLPDHLDNWAGVTTSATQAARIGLEDLQKNWGGPGPLPSAVNIVEHSTHYAVHCA